MKQVGRIAILLGLVLPLCHSAEATTEMSANVIGSGGGPLSATNYRLICTVGQPAIGRIGAAGVSHTCEIGFWHSVSGTYASDTPESPAGEIPACFSLEPAGPSPLRSAAVINYAVPRAAVVSIRLYDITGREVQTLLDGSVEPGYHQATLRTASLPSGVYFCRMTAGGFSTTRKLVHTR